MFGGVFKIKPLSFFFCCSFVTNPGIQVFSAGITKSTHCICNRSYPTDKYIAPLPSVLLNTSMSPFRSLYVSRFLSAPPFFSHIKITHRTALINNKNITFCVLILFGNKACDCIKLSVAGGYFPAHIVYCWMRIRQIQLFLVGKEVRNMID